jgi:hypothetical protein
MRKIILFLSILFLWTCGGGGAKKATGPVVPTQPPTVNNLTITTNEDTPATFTMSGTDPGSFSLTFSIATDPQHGTLSMSGAAGTYTPTANYNGPDVFGYIATNGTLTSVAGVATVTVVAQDDNPNTMDVVGTGNEDTTIDITLEAEEYDGDNITFNIATNPSNGAVTLSGTTASYVPTQDWYGTDTFTFEAVDASEKKILNTATATIVVNPINDAPVVEDVSEQEGVEDTDLTITLTGTDIEGDNLSFEVVDSPTQGSITNNGTSFVYTPNEDFYGADSLTYYAYDGTEYSNTSKIPLFIDRGARNWPFIYHQAGMNGSMNNRPHHWEGKNFDFDGNGLANMIAFGEGFLTVVEEVPNLNQSAPENRYYPVVYSYDVFSNVPSDVWSDGEDNAAYWNGGVAEFGYVNNDNIVDIFVNFTREIYVNGVCCDLDAGPSVLGLSNGFDYTWTVLEDSIQYWQDGNIEFADFDGDGDMDLIGQDDNAYKATFQTDPHLLFYNNQGDNTFTIEKISLTQAVSLEEFRVHDLDKDGIRDIVGFGGGGTGSLHILYGTSNYNVFNYEENNFANANDPFQDLTIVDIDNDGVNEILTHQGHTNSGENRFSTLMFVKNGIYDIDYNTEFYVDNFLLNNGPILKTQAWDFDNDGDKDIFMNQFFKYPDEGGGVTPDYQCCYCFERNLDMENNGGINQGYFWKNNDGVLVKTYYSTKEGECNFDDF